MFLSLVASPGFVTLAFVAVVLFSIGIEPRTCWWPAKLFLIHAGFLLHFIWTQDYRNIQNSNLSLQKKTLKIPHFNTKKWNLNNHQKLYKPSRVKETRIKLLNLKIKINFLYILSYSYIAETLFLGEFLFMVLINLHFLNVKGNKFKYVSIVYCTHCLRWKMGHFCEIILIWSHYVLKMFRALR